MNRFHMVQGMPPPPDARLGSRSIGRLAAELREEWSRAGFQASAFPALAHRRLSELRLHESFSLEQALPSLLAAPLGEQSYPDNRFGQPAITLYQDERLVIDYLFWQRGDTGIHDHNFHGAFTVLHGESLHCLYAFEPGERVCPEISLGRLSLKKTELLRPGESRAIVSGPAFIHQVWHLRHPTVTFIIRTQKEDAPIRRYRRPGLAFDYRRGLAPEAGKKAELLKLLFSIKDASRHELAAELIGAAAPFDAYAFLELYCALAAREPEASAASIRRAAARQGAWLAAAAAAFRSDPSGREAAWSALAEPRPKLLAALLLAEAGREAVYDALARHDPGAPPEESVVRGVGELAKAKAFGLELPPLSLEILRHLLRGRGPEQILDALGGSVADRAAAIRNIRETCAGLRRLPLLGPLLGSAGRFANRSIRRGGCTP